MNALITQEVNNVVDFAKRSGNTDFADDYAFNLFILQYFYFDGQPIDKCFADIEDLVTDGNNDGGVDFVFYDDENDKIILGQAKYRGSLAPNEIVSELDKMSTTLENFYNGQTGAYNDRLKKQLQNAIDRLPEESRGNVEYSIFTTASLDTKTVRTKINNQHNHYSDDMVNIYQEDDIVERINDIMTKVELVDFEKIKIDKAKNYLSYKTGSAEGIIVNISSKSLIALYNTYKDKGLFDLNIRRYVRDKTVDDGIRRTLDSDRDNFWFLNNGLIIACQDFVPDGDTIELYDFSIVNGGQTTDRIGQYKGANSQEFFIPCKIISSKKEKASPQFFNKIAEATNSQKPIYPRDLKSNSPEMRKLKSYLGKQNIELEIKRGDKPTVKKPNYRIKNDELGQFVLSFVQQRPGTSRSGKKRIFDNNDLYNQVFRVNYIDDNEKSDFIISSIDLINRVAEVISALKNSNELTDIQKEILKNGTQVVYALLGVVYRLANGDVKKDILLQNPEMIKTQGHSFTYRKVLNYSYDEINENLKQIILIIIRAVAEKYTRDSKDASLEITSVSNYFKTDKKYYDQIIPGFIEYLDYAAGAEILNKYYIFKE